MPEEILTVRDLAQHPRAQVPTFRAMALLALTRLTPRKDH